MAGLFHHHYLDTRGHAPPNPDLAHFEHLAFFCADQKLRLKGDGIGSSVPFRISRSNDLGQAFCRWFLYTHLNITYFAHIHDVLDKPDTSASMRYTVERGRAGDTPDYFCAETPSRIFLAEAKCRRQAASFANSEFGKWRKQFGCVIVKDPEGNARSIKGHIVAVRLAAESDGTRIESKLFAEDPVSPGSIPLGEETPFGTMIVMRHYASIAYKLAQAILAGALDGNYTITTEIIIQAAVWEFRIGPFEGKRFVGGIYSRDRSPPDFVQENGGMVIRSHPVQLDQPGATFFGVEEEIFRSVVKIARLGRDAARNIPQLPDIFFLQWRERPTGWIRNCSRRFR